MRYFSHNLASTNQLGTVEPKRSLSFPGTAIYASHSSLSSPTLNTKSSEGVRARHHPCSVRPSDPLSASFRCLIGPASLKSEVWTDGQDVQKRRRSIRMHATITQSNQASSPLPSRSTPAHLFSMYTGLRLRRHQSHFLLESVPYRWNIYRVRA